MRSDPDAVPWCLECTTTLVVGEDTWRCPNGFCRRAGRFHEHNGRRVRVVTRMSARERMEFDEARAKREATGSC